MPSKTLEYSRHAIEPVNDSLNAIEGELNTAEETPAPMAVETKLREVQNAAADPQALRVEGLPRRWQRKRKAAAILVRCKTF
mmetsp:Transcript_11685/g.28721  ORF Transcript_11685/g.28721 Transcript_11685/m.28721 type:complete len:82 (-) Transcript_11685:1130-1375(-)